MKYLNNSYAVKTFYGVTFNPGEVHSVPGVIHDPKFFRMDDSTPETRSTSKSSKKDDQTKPIVKSAPNNLSTSATEAEDNAVNNDKLPNKEETK